VQKLLSIMDRLRKDGVAIMFVTHRLEEASAICDRMTVLRDGKLAGHLNREGKPVPLPKIIEKMVGRAASELYARPTQRDVAGDVRLSIRGLRTMRDPEAPHAIVLEGVDLDLRAGEILGVAGLVGSGRTELARAIFGADRIAAGTITLDGQPIAPASPADAIALGIGLVPEDRKRQAIFASLGILPNFSIAALGSFSNGFGFMAERREREALSGFRKMLSIRMASPEQAIEGLSGGNQQKVVLARWAGQKYRVIVLEDPTIGVDIGAKAEIYRMMMADCDAGTSYIVVSSDIEELVNVCDRVLAFSCGTVVAELAGERLTTEALTHAVSGAVQAPRELAS
jgi:inositol transport system ATP-binding protein